MYKNEKISGLKSVAYPSGGGRRRKETIGHIFITTVNFRVSLTAEVCWIYLLT